MLNSKVTSYISGLVKSGTITPSQAAELSLVGGSLDSVNSIGKLSPSLLIYVRDAFRHAVRWSFISLIPWCGLAFFFVLFLSKIPDTDTHKGAQEKAIVDDGDAGSGVGLREEPEKNANAPGVTSDIESAQMPPIGDRTKDTNADGNETAAADADVSGAQPARRPRRPMPRIKGPISMLAWGVMVLVDRIRS